MSNAELLGLIEEGLFFHQRPQEWHMAAELLQRLFVEQAAELAPVRVMAETIRDYTGAMDAYVQRTASGFCPRCPEVCCLAMHGRYDGLDLVYAHALGLAVPDYDEGLKDHDPCQFMSEHGCITARPLRPLRCRLYFCNPLKEHMEKGPEAPYQEFNALLSEAKGLWEKLPAEMVRIGARLTTSSP